MSKKLPTSWWGEDGYYNTVIRPNAKGIWTQQAIDELGKMYAERERQQAMSVPTPEPEVKETPVQKEWEWL
jgi:hypothetical protein